MPAQVLLIRHGEKPPQGNELNEQGWKRAEALPNLFKTRDEFMKYGTPVALFAQKPFADGSLRALQTLLYVSREFQIQTQTPYLRDETTALVQLIKSDRSLDGRMIVICWQHEALKDIAKAFGATKLPAWPAKQFDRVWSLSFASDGQLNQFENLPQRLLPTDDSN